MKIFTQTFSKIFAILSAILTFFLILSLFSILLNKNNDLFRFVDGDKNSNEKIAILKISGPIISNSLDFDRFNIFSKNNAVFPEQISSYLNELRDKKILGLIISLDSPGGSVSASNKIYELIKKYKKETKTPVYFHTSEILASGGYWISLAGDKIYASYGSIVGSIGVKGPDWLYYNSPTSLSSGLLGPEVVSPNGIKLFSTIAGNSKDIFNPFRKPSKAEILELQSMVDDIYNDFVNNVSSSRKIEKEVIINSIGAMIFNSKKALSNYLIDEEIDINQVINLLSKKLNIKSANIISNDFDTKILNIKFLKNIFFKYDVINNNYIQKKFCNNLINEFSAVSIGSYSFNCQN